MKEKNTFGSFIKDQRNSQTPPLTLMELSNKLGISLSYLSDIEHDRKKPPFSDEQRKKLVTLLRLDQEATDLMNYLFVKANTSVPDYVVEKVIEKPTYTNNVLLAMRLSNEGKISAEEWQEFVNKKRGQD